MSSPTKALQTPNPNSTSQNTEIRKTFDLLRQGESNVRLSDQHKNVTLILGNTGVGKSTLVQWLATDGSKLIATETSKDSGQFVVEDGNNKISSSTIDSKTLFPDLVLDPTSNTVFYDCPGFDDTRSTSHDIAATYFTKKIADHANFIKIIFVTSYPSVKKGVTREDFMRLMRHSADLIKDLDKFRDSVAIIVTKVDNNYRKNGKTLTLVPDQVIIGEIADFLKEIKQSIGDKLKSGGLTDRDEKLYRSTITFIDILTMMDGDTYSKIGIFRRPDEPGPLRDITNLQTGKQNIKRIIAQLKFIPKTVEDFGYSVSEESKNDINELVEQINNSIWSSIANIADRVMVYYQQTVEPMRNKIKAFASNQPNIQANFDEAQQFNVSIHKGKEALSALKDSKDNITVKEFAQKINNSLAIIDIPMGKDVIQNITNQGMYLEFFELVSNHKFGTRPWASSFQSVATYLDDSERNIQNDINEATEKLFNAMESDVNAITKEIILQFQNKVKLLQFQEGSKELKKAQISMNNIAQQIKNLNNIQLSNIVKLKIDTSKTKDKISDITNLKKQLNFLQRIGNHRVDIPLEKFVTAFQGTAQYLGELGKWYEFLDDLYAKFSDYNIQKDTSIYNVYDIQDWGHPNKPQSLTITGENFNKFLEKIKDYNVKKYEAVQKIKLTEYQLQELNNVLGSTLRHEVTKNCERTGELEVTGDYIKLSDILKNDTISCCENGVTIELLKIYATNMVIIDRDLNAKGKKLQLIIIAPKWIIEGKRKIILNGAPAKEHESSKAPDGDEYGTGKDGDHGKPGLPGGLAGNFLGIGREYDNGEDLTISSVGGNGGAGQNGGNGSSGGDGEAARLTLGRFPSGIQITFGAKDLEKEFREQIGRYGYEKTGKERTNEGAWPKPFDALYGFRPATLQGSNDYYIIDYLKIEGTSGENGGNGGDGGKGGKGGYGGDIKIIKLLDQTSRISSVAYDGTPGKSGNGGEGAMGGQHGDYTNVAFKPPIEANKLNTEPNSGRGDTGASGRDDFNDSGIRDPEQRLLAPNIARILNEYKSYLRENLNDMNRRFKKELTTEFYTELNNNAGTKNFYGIKEMIDEFQSMEAQYHNHKLGKDDLLSFYRLLLDEIITGAQRFSSSEEKKVLSYLYTTILSKLYSLKDDTSPTLIIDINGYLNYILEDINGLKNLRDRTSMTNIINSHKEAYQNNISKRVDEARKFIQTQITPEINNINHQIDEQINALVEETKGALKKSEQKQRELIEKRDELRRLFPLKKLLSLADITSRALSFMGPVGLSAGTVLETAGSVSESLLVDKSTEQPKIIPSSVVDDIRSAETQIQMIKDQKVENLNDQLDAISEEVTTCPEEFADTQAEMVDIRKKLEAVRKENGAHLDTVTNLEKNFHAALKEKENNLKSERIASEKNSSCAVPVIKNINGIVRTFTFGSDIYNKSKQDLGRLNQISGAIEMSDIEIRKLKQFEEEIYQIITPMLNTMKADFKDTATKLNTKSPVALDITKWRVQSTLKEIKLQIQEFTAGFKVSGSLARCLEKLDEAMTTLINVYDRIENYRERKDLIDYIAHVNSPSMSSIIVTDSGLSDALNRLETLLRSNLVLNQYKLAMEAFTQWVFPFAHLYLKTFTLPSQLQLDGNIENSASTAMAQVYNIRNKLSEYKTSIVRYDQYIHSGEFNSRSASTKPFFVWENKKYANAISKLLSGDSVALKADILKSPLDKDAIKFNSIEINIKSINKTLQPIIDDKLKKFKISVIHNGNSYYRHGDTFYVISSNTQNIQYSFEKNSNGIPIHKNKVYDKIKSGDLLLSPYAMWQLQLMEIDDEFSFDTLSAYKNQIDIELTGTGSYVSKENTLDLKVEDYYDVDVTPILDTNEQQDESENDLQSYPTPTRPKRSLDGWRNTFNHVLSSIPKIGQKISSTTISSFYKDDDTYTNELSDVSNSLDVNGNLTLAQMIVGMAVGENKTLSNNTFVSFEENRNRQIEELASHIRPILELDEDSFGYDQDDSQFQSQWYNDLLDGKNSTSFTSR